MHPTTGSYDAAAIHGDPRPEDGEFARMLPSDGAVNTRVPERSARSLTRALSLRMPAVPDLPQSPLPPVIS